MANLNTLPLEDGFKTTIAQAYAGGLGTMYVNNVPSFTFPSGVTTYCVINPTKSNIQIVEVDSYSSANKTFNISNITIEKGAGVNSVAQTHSVNSTVIISDNYSFWSAIRTAINTKLDNDSNWSWNSATTFAGMTAKSLTEVQRDALTPTNGMIILNTTSGVLNQYIGGAWVSFATGTTANASETVAGKGEVSTDAEITTPTDTGGTGAFLWAKISQLVKLFSFAPSLTTSAETDKFAFQDVSNGDKTTTILKSDLRDDLAGSKTIKGTFEMLTDAEAVTGTDETRVPNIKQIKDNYTNKPTSVFYSAVSLFSPTSTASLGSSSNYGDFVTLLSGTAENFKFEFPEVPSGALGISRIDILYYSNVSSAGGDLEISASSFITRNRNGVSYQKDSGGAIIPLTTATSLSFLYSFQLDTSIHDGISLLDGDTINLVLYNIVGGGTSYTGNLNIKSIKITYTY